MPFPNASTTGVPTGTSLTTVGSFTTSFNGQIIDALNVNGTITVNHTGVTIQNCQAKEIFVNGDGVTIQDCDIIGGAGNSGITILFADNSTIQRCDIRGVENGIWLEARNCLVQDNYFHNLAAPGNPDPHFDGLQIPGGFVVSNLIIRHNNFDLATGVSSSITMRDATNVDIIDNRLDGGTYTIYFEGGTTGSDVTNNVFGDHMFGYVNGTADDAQTYNGNIDEATGASILGGTAPPPDTTPPDAPVIVGFSTDTGTVGDGITGDNTLLLTGTAEANSAVTVSDGASSLGTTSANGSGAWSFSTGVLTVATHSFTAVAEDAAGNDSVASAAMTVIVEAAPPPPPPPTTINGTNGHDDLRGGAGNDTINGLGGQDLIDGAAGNDTLHGNGGKDWLDGGPGADVLWGDSGNDEFVFKADEANGDTVMGFVGNGARTGDILMFVGFGDKQDGATFTRIDTSHYQIHSAIDGHNEIITLNATVHQNDFLFI